MPDKELHILLFSSQGAGTHYYGPGMSAFRLYSELDSDQIKVSLVHGYENQENLLVFDEQSYISDLKGGNVLDGIDFYFKIKKWIRKNAHKYDVVHCLGAFQASFLTAIEFEKNGVPAFIKITESQHTGFTKSSFISSLLGFRRYRLKNANEITGYISISSEISKKLIDAGIAKEKIFRIPNGVNIDRFKPVSNDEKSKLRYDLNISDKFTVLFTGAFSERKNPFLIAKAFLSFKNEEKIQLILVGPDSDDGRHREKIEELVEKNKCNKIHLFNQVEQIEKFYQSADLFVLPSSEEGLSNSMLEAMSTGLPALVTPLSGAKDVIDESTNGIFIEADQKSIYKAIDKYYRDKVLLRTHSKGARKTILNSYSSDLILEKHLKLFRSVL